MSGLDFFTLQRRILDSWIWDLPAEQTKVAVTLIGMANWKEGKTFSRGNLVKVFRGQVMTSLPRLAERSRVSIQTVRSTLKNLKKGEFLTDESTDGFRIITILNYDKHQSKEERLQQANQQAANSQPTGDQQETNRQLTPIEQGNKGTREQGNKIPRKRAQALPSTWSPTEAHHTLAAELYVDLDREAGKFRDHAEASGRVQKNWDASFRLWLKKAGEWVAEKDRNRGRPQEVML